MSGFAFTIAHMVMDETVPASNPQNPPAGVSRLKSMPRRTVPNNGAMKKLKSAWT